MRKTPFILSGAAFALLAILTLLLLVIANVESPTAHDGEFIKPNISPLPVVEPRHEKRSSISVSELVEENVPVDPWVACPDPLGELSDECMQSLDAYFWNRPFVWNGFDWISVAMSYRRIFEDPERDRARVLAALEKPECRLEKGEIRWDLKEHCHAESFSNYANFIYFCEYVPSGVTLLGDDPTLLAASDLDDLRDRIFEDFEHWDEEYIRTSRWAGERLLEGRWIVEKACSKQLALMESHKYVDISNQYERLKTIGKSFDEFSESWGSSSMDAFFYQFTNDKERSFDSHDAFKVLQMLAARLGDEHAASVYESPAEDVQWRSHEAESMPWKVFLKTMRASIMMIRSDFEGENTSITDVARQYFDFYPKIEKLDGVFQYEGSKARTSVLAYTLEAWLQLERAGIKIDLDRMVEYVCGPNWMESRLNCQESLAELSETISADEQHYWHRLEQFKTRSIELDLFDIQPSFRDSDCERKKLNEIK
ncbi:MAG: hypothetical protein F4X44_02745 [Gammaproteobacteria bacterium]|nr:hypothetical protein [Gammaproteobacteria bacterium]